MQKFNMNKRKIGNLEVSAIGLGCMGMSHAYGTQCSEEEARKLVETALDFGCTFFDTAEAYGEKDSPHHNEELVGKVLKPYRNKIQIATKFGLQYVFSEQMVNKPVITTDARPENIRKSV